MTGFEVGLLSVVMILVLIYAGVYVPVALGLVSFVGVWIVKGNMELPIKLLAIATGDSIADYLFGVIPLFVLMGLLVANTGMGRDLYEVANVAFRRIRGGLGIATVAANAFFAAITGVSIASASVFTRISVPEMRRYGHTARFAVGVVAGSSVLGMLIPPSVMLILYAVVAEQSIVEMFIAGIMPGILLSVAYGVAIVAMAYLTPRFVFENGRGPIEPEDTGPRVAVIDRRKGLLDLCVGAMPPLAVVLGIAAVAIQAPAMSVYVVLGGFAGLSIAMALVARAWWLSGGLLVLGLGAIAFYGFRDDVVVAGAAGALTLGLFSLVALTRGGAWLRGFAGHYVRMFPIITLILLVLGGIYGGAFTPTEAGAVGALATLVLAIQRRTLSAKEFWRILVETGHITASILLLIISASMYSRMLGITGIPTAFGEWIVTLDLGLYVVMAGFVVLLLFLGTILDTTSIILIVVPLFLPIIDAHGMSLVWFGIVVVVGAEIGLLTPPLGIACFVIKSTLVDKSISLFDIFAGAFPFAVIMLLVLILIIAFPWLSIGLI
jgi:TRAP-type C4-dicarboxylate transport system permease large subunit